MRSPPQPVIAVDIMGADRGPGEIVEGARQALVAREDFSLVLVGGEDFIRRSLDGRRFRRLRERIQIHPATGVISMDERPMRVLRQKDTSMARAIGLVKEGAADGALTCGNTGALVALGTVRLRPMEHLERPTLATVIPSIDRHFVLLDVGANPSPTPRQMVHNALLGDHYSQTALKNSSPRVGLLSIGTEEGKGNDLVHQTHEMLKNLGGIIHYVGLIEGFQLFRDPPDVVVCDGFVGNVLLKAMESLAKTLKGFIVKELLRNPMRIFGCLFASGALRTIRRKLSTEKYGGAPLLGLNGSLFKAHGASTCREICNAILIARRLLRKGQADQLRERIGCANAILGNGRKILEDTGNG